MYGIFTYIYHKNQPNVGVYTIHGWYGNGMILQVYLQTPSGAWEVFMYQKRRGLELVSQG